MGLELRIAHYPPYESKYNPIEHRLFPHVTRACQGVVFVSVDLVKKLMEKTTTRTGLRVTVDIIAATSPTGVKAPVNFKKTMALVCDALLPKWNYRALPQRLESRQGGTAPTAEQIECRTSESGQLLNFRS